MSLVIESGPLTFQPFEASDAPLLIQSGLNLAHAFLSQPPCVLSLRAERTRPATLTLAVQGARVAESIEPNWRSRVQVG